MGATCCEARVGVRQAAASSAGPSGNPAKNLDDICYYILRGPSGNPAKTLDDICYPILRGLSGSPAKNIVKYYVADICFHI